MGLEMDENVIITRGDLRVRLEQDGDPREPFDDGGSPILRWGATGGRFPLKQLPSTSYKVHGRILDAAREWGFTETFKRYLRIFHGVTQFEEYSHDEIHYISFDPANWREAMGLTEEHLAAYPDVREHMVSLEELRAYHEGDVWGYVVERRVVWHRDGDPTQTRESWEDVDSCWGYYGYRYAEQEARQALNSYGEEDSEPCGYGAGAEHDHQACKDSPAWKAWELRERHRTGVQVYATESGLNGATVTVSAGGKRDTPGYVDVIVYDGTNSVGAVIPQEALLRLVERVVGSEAAGQLLLPAGEVRRLLALEAEYSGEETAVAAETHTDRMLSLGEEALDLLRAAAQATT